MSATKYFILAAALIALVNGAPPPKELCQGSPLKMTDALTKARDTCFTKFNPGSTIDASSQKPMSEPKNMTCMSVCLMQQVGLMTADNKFDTSKLADLAKSVGIPEKAVTSIVEAANTCIKDKGSNIEFKDGNCDSLMPLFQCSGEAFQKICKTA